MAELGESFGRRPQPAHRASPTSAVDLHLVHWSSRPPGFFEGRASAEKAQRRVDAKQAAVDGGQIRCGSLTYRSSLRRNLRISTARSFSRFETVARTSLMASEPAPLASDLLQAMPAAELRGRHPVERMGRPCAEIIPILCASLKRLFRSRPLPEN